VFVVLLQAEPFPVFQEVMKCRVVMPFCFHHAYINYSTDVSLIVFPFNHNDYHLSGVSAQKALVYTSLVLASIPWTPIYQYFLGHPELQGCVSVLH